MRVLWREVGWGWVGDKMGGAFIISRDIFENSIWQNNTEFRLFFLILGRAVWKEEGVKVGDMIIQKGQWLRSYRNLQADLEYTENNAVRRPGKATIQRAISRLIKEERITIKTVKCGTLFTVTNYCKYQDFSHYKKGTRDDAKDSNGTATGQQRDNKKKDNKEKKVKQKDIRTPFEIALDDFKSFRQKIKSPMVGKSMTLLLNKLEELAPGDEATKIKMLEQSIMNGWKSVYAIKGDTPKQQNGKRIPRAFQDLIDYGSDEN